VRLFQAEFIDFTVFLAETGDGYNIVPMRLPRGKDGAAVQELILATSHVPPRMTAAKIKSVGIDRAFKKLTFKELVTRFDQDKSTE
jgi:hypothetical protein